MSNKPKTRLYKTTRRIVERLRDDLNSQDFVLLFAHNGTGKTRLSMDFQKYSKKGEENPRHTLFFNAYTEDYFYWENDLGYLEGVSESDAKHVLKINAAANFFSGFQDMELESRIYDFLHRHVNFDFKIDYEKWEVVFAQGKHSHIKISRGEESTFIWCVFLAVFQLIIDEADSYKWVKYLYIDDPISSLDDNNVIAFACDLAELLRGKKSEKSEVKVKTLISTHHSLFFNVMCNELKTHNIKKYFLNKDEEGYKLRSTDHTPFFHHVAMMDVLQQAVHSGNIYPYHFNVMRSILEKTANFLGFDSFSDCIDSNQYKDKADDVLYQRALNLLSHGAYSMFEPKHMNKDNKELFEKIFRDFVKKYQFNRELFPELFSEQAEQTSNEANPT